MFDEIKEVVLGFLKSRVFVMIVIFVLMFVIVIQRLFTLQIVKGEYYLNNFKMKIEKERKINSVRGLIYDRNGEVLAYNELAYSVKMEDNGTYKDSKEKNKKLNQNIYDLIQIIESHGDKIINNFNVIINESGEYEYSVTDSALKRFIADIYGATKFDNLKDNQKNATADDIMTYLKSSEKFGVADSYSKEEALKIVTVRYAMSTNRFNKYIATTVATEVSEETVAVILENSDNIQGVSIEEDTVRKYVDSEYFASILGYTGKISQDELDELNGEDGDRYDLTDIVGKSGIEQYMEEQLQGTKGVEKVYVDNMGKVIEVADRTEPESGNDVYLTIDKNLQKAVYNIIEQKLAGILVDKIRNVKNYDPASESSAADIKIPIDDVYYALINNNIIDITHFSKEDASDTEKSVQQTFEKKQTGIIKNIEQELTGKNPAIYSDLSKEMKVYESYIVSKLTSDDVLVKSEIDTTDSVYQKWKNETISLKEYLTHAISMNWLDISKIKVQSQYSDSDEVYNALVQYLKDTLKDDYSFNKKLYKYMIANNEVSGKQICLILYDQGILEYKEEDVNALTRGSINAYDFMLGKIQNLEITPAQLALDPCSGSCVVTDVNTGEVLALVAYPSYDNNRLANSVDADYYSQLLNDLSKPLYNRATQQRTAPGSTFKMISSVAGLEEHKISVSEQIVTKGIFDKVQPEPRCWIYTSSHGTHGSINVEQAIRHSCNYFFYEVGYRLSLDGTGKYNADLGIEKLTKYAKMFGLGDLSGVEIVEKEPHISTEYPVTSAIGQGNHSFTNVQLARYVTTVANSGTCYNLSLLDKVTDSEGNVIQDYTPSVLQTLDIADSTWNAIHHGMRLVAENTSSLKNLSVAIAGKTGTAQEDKTRPNHGLFVGYAPYDNPEIAMSIQIAFGYTSANAAEVARDVVSYYYKLADESQILSGTATQPNTGVIVD